MEIQVITIEEPEKWDKTVRSFEKYDVFYLSEYVKAFQNHGDGVPLLFYCEGKDTRGINVVMQRDIALDKNFLNKLAINTYFDISSPYGYGGWLFEGRHPEIIEDLYIDFCKNSGYICEFVRFNLFNGYEKIFKGESETRTHNVVRALDLSSTEIVESFDRKVRKNIRKACKSGLSIEVDKDGKNLNDFLNIYYGTMERSNADKNFFFDENFFKELTSTTNNSVFFHVLHEGKVISTELVIYGSEYSYSYLGGTDKDYFNLRPNDFLKNEIINWSKENGLKGFVLGGGYGGDDGIFNYKRSFAPNGIYDFYIGRRIFNKDKYNELIDIKSQTKVECSDSNFFPLYRG
jgi:hypothetical protein